MQKHPPFERVFVIPKQAGSNRAKALIVSRDHHFDHTFVNQRDLVCAFVMADVIAVPVSYTHLTLPTILRVQIFGGLSIYNTNKII